MDVLDQLEEELTCQQVMLSSLDGEVGDSIEAEREEIRTDIARLERLLERARRGEDAIEDPIDHASENDGEWPSTSPLFLPLRLWHNAVARPGG